MTNGLRVLVVFVALTLGTSLSAMAQQQPLPRDPALPPEAATEPDGFLVEPLAVRRAVLFGDRHLSSGEARQGVYADLTSLVPGAGWLAAGAGYRHWFSEDRAMAEASAVVSWRAYKTMQARIELPRLLRSRLAVGSHLKWNDFTQIMFFGEGADSSKDDRSEYRLRSTNLVGYATLRPLQWIGVTGTLGYLAPSVLPRAGTFLRDHPDARQLFRDNPVYTIPEQPSFVHAEAAVVADTRDFPGHPTRGVLLRGAASRYFDREAERFSFKRYEGEAEWFVPLADSRLVLAAHGWLVASHPDAGHSVPFYLQPSLGGTYALRGYSEYRFHDRHLLSINTELRVALTRHVDVALLVDAGNVAARVADLDVARRSYGGGVRLHTRRQTVARLDIARSGEGWRAMFNVSDPLTLSRAARHTAPAPFVP